MRPLTFRLIAIITSLALIGVIFTQSFWVKNAIKHQEEQFNAKVKIALKTVANQLFDLKSDSLQREAYYCQETCTLNISGMFTPKFAVALDSLICVEFNCMGLHKEYIYGLYNEKGIILPEQNAGNFELIKNSRHNISLSCIHRSGGLHLGVYFYNQRGIVMRQLAGWIVLSVIFTLTVIISYTLTVLSFLRQKKLSEMKSDFVSNMTHEFKTPISTISLASEMLTKPQVVNDADKVKKYAAMIYNENTRLKNQVEHVLQVTAFEEQRITLNYESLDLFEALKMVGDVFDLYARESGGKVVFDNQATVKKIYTDKIHFTNVVSNLLENAVKYASPSPVIRLEARDHTFRGGNGVLISVSDNGPGISPEYQRHIFKKFYRIPTGNRHDVKGFGLGLYYVKTIAALHGGWVQINSQPGKGSRFSVFFPEK